MTFFSYQNFNLKLQVLPTQIAKVLTENENRIRLWFSGHAFWVSVTALALLLTILAFGYGFRFVVNAFGIPLTTFELSLTVLIFRLRLSI